MSSYYSVRMRSAQGGSHEAGGLHISGGEGLWREPELREAVDNLLNRALTHERGEADFIQIRVERVQEGEIRRIAPLAVSEYQGVDVAAAHERACQLLVQAGVEESVARLGLKLLEQGPGPGGTVMRGAVLLDGETGKRLEADPIRGVRASRIGWDPEALEVWRREQGIEPSRLSRVAEAVALASKVAAHPATLAELCWSDDPGYITGYVASPQGGYVRLTPLKAAGNSMGGRIFFLRKNLLDSYVHYLENTPVLIGL